MSFVAKLANPVLNIKTAAVNYYKPMVRAGSSTPLWHFFMITSGVMYTIKVADLIEKVKIVYSVLRYEFIEKLKQRPVEISV